MQGHTRGGVLGRPQLLLARGVRASQRACPASRLASSALSSVCVVCVCVLCRCVDACRRTHGCVPRYLLCVPHCLLCVHPCAHCDARI